MMTALTTLLCPQKFGSAVSMYDRGICDGHLIIAYLHGEMPVIMMVADVLAPYRCQDISTHHADVAMIIEYGLYYASVLMHLSV